MDLSEPGEMDRRTWRWFQTRLFGLPVESRTWRHLVGERASTEDEASIEEADAAFGVDRE